MFAMHAVEAKGFKIPLDRARHLDLARARLRAPGRAGDRIGYRHIDTAQMYGNEREVGEGVRASGMRAEVMVTTKIQPTNAGAARRRTLGQGKPRARCGSTPSTCC